jgi:hypothetical protein
MMSLSLAPLGLQSVVAVVAPALLPRRGLATAKH